MGTAESSSTFDDDQLPLFELPAEDFERGKPLRFRPLEKPLWTMHKAALVATYLKYFLYITKHGTYIDAFAGPQSREDGGWAAELVLGIEPAWLRRFELFEQDSAAHAQLAELKARYPNRRIEVGVPTDSNIALPTRLPERSFKATEAAFCLLDQRTFECSWALCEHVARLKSSDDRKVEQFYFLAHGWLDRAFEATSTPEGRTLIERWWGKADWADLRGLRGEERAVKFSERFVQELGYRYATPWPIFKSASRGGPVMYFMIHATDHDEAPVLMRRAYNRVVQAPAVEQLELDFSMEDTAEFAGLADLYAVDE